MWIPDSGDIALAEQARNCSGTAGKNILEGPGKKMSIRSVFSQPDPFMTDGSGAAGVITSTVMPDRQIQFALKLEF